MTRPCSPDALDRLVDRCLAGIALAIGFLAGLVAGVML